MEVVRQSEFCGKPALDNDKTLASIPTGLVFRARIGNNLPHVWMKTKNGKALCIAEGASSMEDGKHAYTDSQSIVHEFEELDAVIVIKD